MERLTPARPRAAGPQAAGNREEPTPSPPIQSSVTARRETLRKNETVLAPRYPMASQLQPFTFPFISFTERECQAWGSRRGQGSQRQQRRVEADCARGAAGWGIASTAWAGGPWFASSNAFPCTVPVCLATFQETTGEGA